MISTEWPAHEIVVEIPRRGKTFQSTPHYGAVSDSYLSCSLSSVCKPWWLIISCARMQVDRFIFLALVCSGISSREDQNFTRTSSCPQRYAFASACHDCDELTNSALVMEARAWVHMPIPNVHSQNIGRCDMNTTKFTKGRTT